MTPPPLPAHPEPAEGTAAAIWAIGEVSGPHAAPHPCATSLLDADLHLDSLHVVSIAMELEEAYGVALSDDQVACWASVADIARAVEAQLAKAEERA